MAITPGDKFEPPHVGSYSQGVHGEGDPFASARSGQELRFHKAPPAMFPSPWGRGTKGEGKRCQRIRRVAVVKQRADRCSWPRLYPLETSRNQNFLLPAASFLFAALRLRGFALLYGLRYAIHNWLPWTTFSLSPLRGAGRVRGARVVYPKHSSVRSPAPASTSQSTHSTSSALPDPPPGAAFVLLPNRLAA